MSSPYIIYQEPSPTPQLALPGTSDLALALREPALLVPGRKPVGPVAVCSPYRPHNLYLFRNDYRDLQRNFDITTVGGNVAFGGNGLVFGGAAGSTAEYVELDVYPTVTNTVWSFSVTFTPSSVSGGDEQGILFCMPEGGNGGIGAWIISGVLKIAAGHWNNIANVTTPVSVGKKYTLTVSVHGTGFSAYLNGSFVGTKTWGDIVYTSQIAQLGRAFNGLYGDSFRGTIESFAVWRDVALPDPVARSISSDPYQILKPANSSPYLIALPGGATPTLPTLTNPTLVSAGGNNYYPRVTATY